MKLIELFNNPEPWIIEINKLAKYNDPIKDLNGKYYYIYCWVNLDTQWCYIGMHLSTNPYNLENYLGSSANPHYWNSRKSHKFKCIILSYVNTKEELIELESLIINESLLDKFKGKGIYNLKLGGIGSFTTEYGLQKSLETRLSKYPESNGTPPNWWISARKSNLEKYPDTNGISPNTLNAAHKSFRLNRIFQTIERNLARLNSNNLELNASNYLNKSGDRNCKRQHLPRVINLLDELRLDSRWCDLYESIFSKYEFNIDPISNKRTLTIK